MTEVPDSFWTGAPSPSGHRTFTVVVGVSETSGSPTALSWAYGEARLHGGQLVAIRAWRPPRPPAAVGAKPSVIRYDVDAMQSDADQELRATVTEILGADVDVECRLIHGGRRRSLVEASRTADLVVVDAPRRTDLRTSPRFARKLIYQARCPVVIMPPALAREPDTAVVAAGKRLGHGLARAAATAGRPGIRPPASPT